jgi:hypothetical protein
VAQSPEYPDLKWMPPKSWTNANRDSVQLVVIHTTEGSSGIASAEDGAAYDQRRTDGTSTHYFHDSDSTIQCVRTDDQAHAARAQGNRRGIQHELCAKAGSQNWDNSYAQAMLRRAARQVARDCKKWDIPVRHLTVSQVADGVKGICGHYDITRAFPQDGGTHTDPGNRFPWTDFLNMVRDILDPPAPEKPKEWSDMATEDQLRAVVADEIDKALNANRGAYQLTRLADRGNSPLTHKKLQEYLFEQLVSPPARPAADGPAPDGTSLQARLERIERALEHLTAGDQG